MYLARLHSTHEKTKVDVSKRQAGTNSRVIAPEDCDIICSTDGIHCRESAGTWLVVLKVVPGTGAAFSDVSMDQFLCARVV